MDRNQLKTLFLSLPHETDWDYEKKLVDLALDSNSPDSVEALKALLTDEAEEEPFRFNAFCALCEVRRRKKDYSEEKKLLEEYEPLFGRHPFFGHVKLLYYVDNFEPANAESIFSLAEANAAQKAFSQNPGVHHILADLVATAFENAELSGLNIPDPVWLQKGLRAADAAILLNPDYAKYYCTKGRLLALLKDYDAAVKMIRQAVDLEDSRKSDYAIRINGYLNHLQQVQARQQNDHMEKNLNSYMNRQMDEYAQKIEAQQAELRQQTDNVMNELQDSMSKNLEFIGLFAGIISFTIGSISIAGSLAEVSFAAAAGLIIVLMGALLCVFAGFGIVLHGFENKKWIRNLIIFLLGLAAAGFGLFFCCNL